MGLFAALAPAILGGIGSLLDKKSAKSPDMPEAPTLEEITRLMFVNQQSPFGSTQYTEGPGGQWNREHQFSDAVQPIFDRGVDRAVNPDLAYQMPPQLQQLHQALMNQRLEQGGQAQRRPRPDIPERPDLMRPQSSIPLEYR